VIRAQSRAGTYIMVEVRLKVRGGKSAGQEIRLPGAKFIIGRAEDCHLRPNSDLVSRHHCAILSEEGFVTVRDFGSKNGTLVNGERISGECELKSGDVLKVGPLEFDVFVIEQAPAKKRPAVHSIKEAAARTAQGNPGQGGLDVDQWLTEPEGTGLANAGAQTTEATTNTVNIRDGDTEEIDLGRTMAVPPGTIRGVEPDAPTREMPSTPAKAVPGKLPPLPSSKDSGSAAADTLRKFFNRR